METIIITANGLAAGKTYLAQLLTNGGRTGAILDCSGCQNFTAAGVKMLMLCPRVVITGDSAADIRANPKLKDFFSLRPPIVLKIARGDDSPLVPDKAKSSPAKFREWVLNQGNYNFCGGSKALKQLLKSLPKNPTLNDLLNAGAI